MKCLLVDFKKHYFSHLPDAELNIMSDLEKNERSFCFELRGDRKPFHVFLDVDSYSVHVRHIGGSFAWRWGYIANLCDRVAEQAKLKKISVIADKEFMQFAVKKLGFKKVDDFLYEREC